MVALQSDFHLGSLQSDFFAYFDITPLCCSVTYMFWALPFFYNQSIFWMWLARNISWPNFDITSVGCSVL